MHLLGFSNGGNKKGEDHVNDQLCMKPSEGPKLTGVARLVSVLSDFDKAGDQGMLDQVQVGSLGNVARRL